uniref:phosphoinositide phosphatase SAC6-like n=1 Tax=Erigeron canadensis TaxID=72917 RepID=UPI001CB9792F|nr:phosphoinositide phosphatase SAC6-like [Erigeron canadensis]
MEIGDTKEIIDNFMMEKAEHTRKLYTRMRLWELPDQYVAEPLDVSSGSCLAVNRDGSMALIDEVPHCTTVRVPRIQTIYGVVGIVKLLAGSYLVVITERECVGSFLGHPIYKVLSLKVFSCDRSAKNSWDDKKKMESEFYSLLKVAEKTPGLYFSYNVNITLSTQRLNYLGEESSRLPLWRQAEPRFLWNNFMLEPLVDNKLDPYILPILQGSFQNFQAAIGKDIIDVTLIARRCTRRNGTRMWRRGADADGYVANFVESEQIIQLKGHTASFVQVRGSIPLIWDQIVDLSYKPMFEILKSENAPRVAERHFLDLRKKYGNILAIDLVNTRGDEGRLSEKFATSVQNILNNDMRYFHFDFHKICGHVHFERLNILYDQIEDFLIKNRYYMLNDKGEKVETQIGIVRTNCVDCLDRTNVTQSMIGRKMLEFQLQRLGLFDADESISTHPNFDDCFKILWADHGDDISIQYSGTPALKGDFVRFGRRTIRGILKDGWNALLRYYLNNFVDGTKQDSIDLVHGHYIVSFNRDMAPNLKKGGIEAIAPFPVVLGLILMGIFFSLLSLLRVRNDYWQLPLSLFWATSSILTIQYVRANCRAFCNRPQLHKPTR